MTGTWRAYVLITALLPAGGERARAVGNADSAPLARPTSRAAYTVLPKHKGKVLHVPHHQQQTGFWCWAASIAMVAEYLKKTPIDDCDVASRLSRAQGGDGRCCIGGKPIEKACYRGQNMQTMTEVMNAYFNLTPTDFHRPLTWQELKTTIDAGYPVVATLYWGGPVGHAIVINGYVEPDFVVIEDPAVPERGGLWGAHYLRLANKKGIWKGSIYLSRDETAGYFAGGQPSAHDEPVAPPIGPARSTLDAALPSLKETAVAKRVLARLDARLPAVRACYDDAIEHRVAVPSQTRVRLSFALRDGTPEWITIKEGGGLPRSVTDCVSQAVVRWKGAFPSGPEIGDSQILDLTFAKLPAVAEAPSGYSAGPGTPK